MTTERKKRLTVVFGVLILAAVWMAVLKPSVDFKKLLPSGTIKQVESIGPGIFDEKTDYLALIASARQTSSSFVYTGSERRDPMIPLVVAPRTKLKRRTVDKPPPKVSLEGIIWSQEEPIAVINGTILKVHDFIGGAKVLQIDRDQVTLLYRSKRFVFRLE